MYGKYLTKTLANKFVLCFGGDYNEDVETVLDINRIVRGLNSKIEIMSKVEGNCILLWPITKKIEMSKINHKYVERVFMAGETAVIATTFDTDTELLDFLRPKLPYSPKTWNLKWTQKCHFPVLDADDETTYIGGLSKEDFLRWEDRLGLFSETFHYELSDGRKVIYAKALNEMSDGLCILSDVNGIECLCHIENDKEGNVILQWVELTTDL